MSETDGEVVRLRVKVVPGGSRDQLAGPIGDALKVKLAAPAEGGRANKALRKFLVKTLGVPAQAVTIERGATAPHKQVRIVGVAPAVLRERLGLS